MPPSGLTDSGAVTTVARALKGGGRISEHMVAKVKETSY